MHEYDKDQGYYIRPIQPWNPNTKWRLFKTNQGRGATIVNVFDTEADALDTLIDLLDLYPRISPRKTIPATVGVSILFWLIIIGLGVYIFT